ncbi:MAG TPA: hypothetical protein DD379_19760 [Cyanobacteria bacterium UBA11162]|nr:hypothetical protein [Cyanobacteria bacterium UBA11162]
MEKPSICRIPFRISTTACLTLWLTLGFPPLKILANSSKSPASEINISNPSYFLKCGYRQKQISLQLPTHLQEANLIQKGGSRIEDPENLRCQGHQPDIPLIALLPQSTMGITLDEYPTFLVYIPDVDLEYTLGELVIYADEDTSIYSQRIELKDADSIIKIEMSNSPSLPKLEIGKSYFWTFTILFDPIDRSDSTYVSGWIERVEANSDLQHQLSSVLPQQQPSIYAANGIWYEALTSLAKLHCSDPNDVAVTADWESLLQQVGLSEIASKPIAQCQ